MASGQRGGLESGWRLWRGRLVAGSQTLATLWHHRTSFKSWSPLSSQPQLKEDEDQRGCEMWNAVVVHWRSDKYTLVYIVQHMRGYRVYVLRSVATVTRSPGEGARTLWWWTLTLMLTNQVTIYLVWAVLTVICALGSMNVLTVPTAVYCCFSFWWQTDLLQVC